MESQIVEYAVESALTQPNDLVKGGVYIYTRGQPVKCHGYHYRLIDKVKDVPSYQNKVLVEALDGPDKGLLFVCSINNFCTRYVPAPPERKDAEETKVA